MRLIDADALLAKFNKKSDLWTALTDEKTANDFALYCKVADAIDDAPTVNILQKLWNALYAEEDKFEKRYISTPEHDNWFLVYRPWLQDGFEIAIKVLSEIFAPEPPKEK